jgi:hypothetical protein
VEHVTLFHRTFWFPRPLGGLWSSG